MEDIELSGLVRIVTDVVKFDWFNPHKKASSYQSIGTGFFIDLNGYILTCAHVIRDAIKVSIVIPSIGKDKFDAEIISMCPLTDIALLKATNYKNISYLKLGDSDKIKPKDQVTAVGYPLGQDRLKYTSGIVSGIQGSLIQTDAPINSGNSGGPLLSEENMVVGINSSKIASSSADNIGYAVPIYEFNILKEIMYSGQLKIIRKPQLLVNFNNIDENILSYSKSACTTGYLITNIYKISPLYEAGLRQNDVLCMFDGYKLDNFGETKVPWSTQKVHITELISRYKIGDVIEIKFWSHKKQKFISSMVDFDNNEKYKIKTIYPQFESVDYEIINGCIVMELTMNHLDSNNIYNTTQEAFDNVIKYYDTNNRLDTVLIITKVFGGSYMKKVDNITYGEILTEVNGSNVNTLTDFRNAMLKPVDNKYIIFKTEINNLFVNTLTTLISEEKFLSNKHSFPLSKLYKQLINVSKGEKVTPYKNPPKNLTKPLLLHTEINYNKNGNDYWVNVVIVSIVIYILYVVNMKSN